MTLSSKPIRVRILDRPEQRLAWVRSMRAAHDAVPAFIIAKMEAEYEKQWQCSVCGARYVIPDFARECEANHRADQ